MATSTMALRLLLTVVGILTTLGVVSGNERDRIDPNRASIKERTWYPNETLYCAAKYPRVVCDTTGCFPASIVNHEIPFGSDLMPARPDGRCGKDFGYAVCDPRGPLGPCCSQKGWCGSTHAHCALYNHCQSGCGDLKCDSDSDPEKWNIKRFVDEYCSLSSRKTSIGLTDLVINETSKRILLYNLLHDANGMAYGNGSIDCESIKFGRTRSLRKRADSDKDGEPVIPRPDTSVPQDDTTPGSRPAPKSDQQGKVVVWGKTGVPAMHAALMPNGNVVFLDKIENYTEIKLGDGRLAFSTEWDFERDELTALPYETNAFCSGGTFLQDGTLISVGGNGPLIDIDNTISDGFDGIRYLTRSSLDGTQNGTRWMEPGYKLASKRWYASVEVLLNGNVFVASGSFNGLDPTVSANNNPTWELLDAQGHPFGQNLDLDILVRNQPYFMYPKVHLMPDGSLFIFVARQSQLFDVDTNAILKELPDLPGLTRSYPTAGGSVMLPLTTHNNFRPEILICGGAAYQDITSPTDPSCGLISPLDSSPRWTIMSMPSGRVMTEGIILPDGTVLWINGAKQGAEGFGLAEDPALDFLLYDPTSPKSAPFKVVGSSTIPRLYHSVALLLPDGRVMIAGSNPNEMPVLAAAVDPTVPSRKYPTEFRIELFEPPYLAKGWRPSDVRFNRRSIKADGTVVTVHYKVPEQVSSLPVKVCLHTNGFVTHGLHMGQRMVCLEVIEANMAEVCVRMPGSAAGALPRGGYWAFVVVGGVPSVGQFVMVE